MGSPLQAIMALLQGQPKSPVRTTPDGSLDIGSILAGSQVLQTAKSPYERTLRPGETRNAGDVQDMLAEVILAAGSGALPGAGPRAQASRPPGARRRIVYHGTGRDFEKFDLEAPHVTGGGLNKYGASTSPDPKVASRYATDFQAPGGVGANVRRLAITPRKTLKLSAIEFEKLQSLVGKLDRGEKLSEFQQIDVENIVNRVGGKPGMHPIEAIKAAGYEAIDKAAGRGGAEPEVLVLNLNRIKPTPWGKQ